MDKSFRLLTEDEFDKEFTLIPSSDGSDVHDSYDDEAHHERRLWTWVDNDSGGTSLLSGYHLVNRFGYAYTKEPVPYGVSIEVTIEPEDY